jgi:hypothetical protein
MTTTAVETIQRDGDTLAQELAALVVQDAASYKVAGSYRVQIKAHLARIDDLTTPMLVAARANLKAAQEQDKALREPALAALKRIDALLSGYIEQERRAAAAAQATVAEQQRQAQAVADEIARQTTARLREEAAAARALDAEIQGVPVESVPAPPVVVVKPAPVFVPPAIVAAPPKAEGVSSRELWGAEVTDFRALVQAVAEGTVEIAVLQPNTTVLNGLARTLRAALNLPGVTAVSKRIMAGGPGR